MCGFAGFLRPSGFDAGSAESVARAMAARLAHRGPDDEGVWTSAEDGLAFGHRRLSIVDLSPAGHQPMTSPSGRYVIAFNGEIYNHHELRRRSETLRWRGTSDTESLLAAFDVLGVEATLRLAVGMFGFAVWDRRERELVLARDRMGEKPVYYGWQGDTLVFGSELKALRAHPAFRGEVDHEALAAYLKYGYVPAPKTVYHGIRKLPPGTTWRLHGHAAVPQAAPHPAASYWSLADVAAAGAREPFDGDDAEAADELEARLGRAVELQRVADVPLGAFLSGGIDSSTIVALMQRQSDRPIRTFTIGFSEASYDESHGARAVAEHLGTDHTELTVTPGEVLDVIPRLPTIYDEPFGDASAVPTWLVAGLARREVTVALSGDGGDELFAGYGRYDRTSRLWLASRGLPAWARSTLAHGLGVLPADALQSTLMRAGIGRFPHLFADRVRGLRTAFAASTVDELYDVRMSRWPDPTSLLQADVEVPRSWASRQPTERDHPTERMMAFDARSYLPDDVLVKVDRAAMAHSLETRVPLLDHRVVEFVWSLPHRMRVRDGTSKWLLRQVLDRHVPRELVDRPKMGFGVPMDVWLRGPLRAWAEERLSVAALEGDGPFRAEPIRRCWKQHLDGTADWQHRLWPILAYQEWAATASATRGDD